MRAGGPEPWRLFAAGLTGLLALTTLAAVVGVSTRSNWKMQRFIHQAAAETRTVPVAAGQTLTLRVKGAGGVTVADGPPGQATLSAALRWFGRSPRAAHLVWSVSQSPGGPLISVSVEPRAWLVFGFAPEAMVRVALPQSASVAVTEDNGTMALGGTHPSAALHVANADIEVTDFHGHLAAGDSNGRITVAGGSSDAGMDLSNTNGDIRVTGAVIQGGADLADRNARITVSGGTIQGAVELTNDNGDIVMSKTAVSGALSARTSSGRLELTGTRLSGTFDLHSTDGSIRYAGSGGGGGQAVTTNGGIMFSLDTPSGGGHYVVSTPSGQQLWPSSSGATLGTITLGSTNGGVHFLGGGGGA